MSFYLSKLLLINIGSLKIFTLCLHQASPNQENDGGHDGFDFVMLNDVFFILEAQVK